MQLKKNLRHLPMLAAVLGRSYGVRIVFDSRMETAATDGKTIYLPAMCSAGTEDDVVLLSGLIDHEAAHVRYTDFGAAKDITKLAKAMENIMEDVRIERRIGEVYRGVPSNLNRTLNILVDKGIFKVEPPAEDAPLARVLTGAMLHGLRSSQLRQGILDEPAAAYRLELEKRIGPTLCQKIWDEAIRGTWSTNTHEVVAAANRIETLIKEAAEEPPEEEQPEDQQQEAGDGDPQEEQQDGDSQEQEGSGSGQDEQEDAGNGDPQQSGSSSADQPQDGADPQSQGDAGNGQPMPGQPNGSDSGDTGTGQQDPSTAEIAKAAQEILDQFDDDAIADGLVESTELSNQLQQAMPTNNGSPTFMGEATDVGAGGNGFARGSDAAINTVWPQDTLRDLANQMVWGLDRRVESLLEAKLEQSREFRRSGRLATDRLARLAVGRQEVFYSRQDVEGLNTAVLVVMDMSGSMQTADVAHAGTKISRERAAAAATFALTRSMARLDIPFGVVQFNGGKTLVSEVDSQRGPVESLRCGATGGTDTPRALRGAAELIEHRPEERKLIILIIDGDDNATEMEAVLSETVRRGIEVAGVFIGGTGASLKALFDEDMIQVTDSKDLAEGLFEALQKVAA